MIIQSFIFADCSSIFKRKSNLSIVKYYYMLLNLTIKFYKNLILLILLLLFIYMKIILNIKYYYSILLKVEY